MNLLKVFLLYFSIFLVLKLILAWIMGFDGAELEDEIIKSLMLAFVFGIVMTIWEAIKIRRK